MNEFQPLLVIEAAPNETAGKAVMVSGGWIKTASVMDEDLQEGDSMRDPEDFIAEVKRKYPRVDIITFAQRIPDLLPRYNYPMEWDNMAAIPIASFESWWEQLGWKRRRNVRRAENRGVIVRQAQFDDAFVRGIKKIYDETPVRQGKRFWHYGKDLETIKRENSTYHERSEYIGAYLGEELIGFIRMVYVGPTAALLQILSMTMHTDKCTTNALIAKAVEISANKGLSHLIYAKYICSNAALTAFKRHNGFEQILFPRYFVPVSPWGALALKLNLHKGIRYALPEFLVRYALKLRSKWFQTLARLSNRRGEAV